MPVVYLKDLEIIVITLRQNHILENTESLAYLGQIRTKQKCLELTEVLSNIITILVGRNILKPLLLSMIYENPRKVSLREASITVFVEKNVHQNLTYNFSLDNIR